MNNPFLKTKENFYPTYMIIPQPAKKTLSILPVEETPQNISEEIAKSALKLEVARKISVSGDATGAVLFDGNADAEIKLIVKNSERATKDGEGKNISKTYATKSDLNEYAKKSEVAEKLNYLEKILYATKTAVNEVQSDVSGIKDGTVTISGDVLSGEDTFAEDEDIDSLFGD